MPLTARGGGAGGGGATVCFSITSGQTGQNSAGMWTVTRIMLRTLKKRGKRIKKKFLLRLLEENVCSLIPAVLFRRYNLTSAIRAARCVCSRLPWWKTFHRVKVGSSLLACLGLVYRNVGGGWGRSSWLMVTCFRLKSLQVRGTRNLLMYRPHRNSVFPFF